MRRTRSWFRGLKHSRGRERATLIYFKVCGDRNTLRDSDCAALDLNGRVSFSTNVQQKKRVWRQRGRRGDWFT